MGDAIEDMKAMDALRKEERAAAWANRGGVVAQIEAAGFTVRTVSEESRHLRVYGERLKGWFDLWPSTGRWAQSQRPMGQRQARGSGIDDLMAALATATGVT